MTPTNPTEVQMKLAREALAQAATELAPPSSSMRMNDFTDKAAQISARALSSPSKQQKPALKASPIGDVG